MSKAATEWAEVLATLTPEQLRLYAAAEAVWQAELDAYIKDYKRQASNYLRRRPSAQAANCTW